MEPAGFFAGLQQAITLVNLGYALLGAVLGTIVGILPGLGPTSAMAILLPVVLYLPPVPAVILLSGIYYGAMYGGSTTAILMNVPGEVSSTVTAIDGFAMTRNGRAGEALAIAGIGSFLAGILGTTAIGVLGPSIANFALSFGPPEYFALVTLSLVALVSFSGDSLLRGAIAAVFGAWIATVGVDPLTGIQRLNFGTVTLMQGLDIVPVLVGLFGIAEVLVTCEAKSASLFTGKLGSWWSMLPRGVELGKGMLASVRGTAVGFVLGMLPGMLPALTAYLAYDLERRVSKHREQFGRGAIEGVAGPEAANNATAMAGFVPLISLGIPTSPALAIMLGALMINGLTPGPKLFTEQALFTWTVIASMVVANLMLLVLNLPLIGLWARITVVPYRILGPIVLAFCVVGAFAARNSLFDVAVALACGVLGYAMRKLRWPLAPLILGLLLGPMLEQSLRQSLSMSGGSLAIFAARPVSVALLVAAFAVMLLVAFYKRRSIMAARMIAAGSTEA